MKLYPNISGYFLIWIISLLIVLLFGLSGKDLTTNLANWDGGHYLNIAQNGYQEKYQYAFFPLYPLAIRGLYQITGNYLITALVASIASSFFALHFLYQLVSLDFSKKLAEKTVLFLLIFPTSFFLITAYSEGLFLLLTLAAFYFLRKGNLFLATLMVVMVTATRITGLAVSAALIIQVFLQRGGINRKNWIILLSPLGFIIYCIYLFNTTGDPFFFLSAESSYWQRSLAIPGLSFWETLKSITQSGFITNHFNSFLELLFAVFGLGMVLRSFRFLPAGYAVFGLLSVMLPITTSSLGSMPRFLLPVFPIFILLAMVKNPKAIFFAQLISILLLSAMSILFINGSWAG